MTNSPELPQLFEDDINLNGLFDILNPENNLVLADDMMLSDAEGVILWVSENYEKNFGFAHGSIVGKSAFDLEQDGTFDPCITAEVLRQKKKITTTQTINRVHKNVMTVGAEIRRVFQHSVHGADQRYPAELPQSAKFLAAVHAGDRGAAYSGYLHLHRGEKRRHAAAVDTNSKHGQHKGQHSHHRRDWRG